MRLDEGWLYYKTIKTLELIEMKLNLELNIIGKTNWKIESNWVEYIYNKGDKTEIKKTKLKK